MEWPNKSGHYITTFTNGKVRQKTGKNGGNVVINLFEESLPSYAATHSLDSQVKKLKTSDSNWKSKTFLYHRDCIRSES